MKNLTKTQLQEIMQFSIDTQHKIAERVKNSGDRSAEAESWDRFCFAYQRSLYKTALFYFCNEAGYVVDGVKQLEYKELLDFYEKVLKDVA